MSEKLEINIVYAEGDNKPIIQNRGWVAYFEKFLYMMLKQTMNRNIQINLISDSDGKINDTQGLHILILSPDFILSGACLDKAENLFLENKSEKIHDRIFPIFKSPLSYVDIPEKLRALRSYIFYLSSENHEQELSEFFTKEAEKGYWMKMVDLCFDIYETILNMNLKNKEDKAHGRKAIYLAETGQDLSGARNIIKRELTRHGYEVYPKSLLPHTYKEVKKSIQNDLKKCNFSIHMIGSSYGTIPNGTESSIMDIQNTLASDYTAENPQKFNRLIWISPSLKYASEKQKSFIHNIKRDDKASFGAEVLHTSLEDFKNTLWEELLDKGLNKKLRNAFSTEEQDKPIIYLIYDEIDAEAIEPLKKQIVNHDVQLITLDNKGGLMDLRNKHIDALKQMDAAIVFQENVNSQWVYMKLLDLLKAPGFGRSKPILGKLFKSELAKGSEDEYISRYEVEVDASKKSENLSIFIKNIKKTFEESRIKIAEES
jgi:dsDNA-binding SOS-regulon protein